MLVGDIVRKNARWYPDKLALVDVQDGTRLTWVEENNRTNRGANALLELGLEKGDRAAILSDNYWYFYELYFTLGKSGIIGVPVNVRLHPEEMVSYLNYTRPRVIIAGPEYAELARYLKEHVRTVQWVIGLYGSHGLNVDYAELVEQGSPEEPKVDLGPDDPYMFGMTSGTTGVPKAVILTHRNAIASSLRWLACNLEYTADSIALQNIPMYFNPGGAPYLHQLIRGGRMVVYGQFSPEGFLKTVEAEHVTHAIIVVTMLNMILNYPDVRKHDVSSLRCLFCGGSPFSQALLRQGIEIFGNIFRSIYGMTEAYGVITMLPPEEQKVEGTPAEVRRLGSVGKPLPGVDIKVVNNDGREVAWDGTESGEILVKSELISPGYWEMPEENALFFKDGWFHTGDVGIVDEQGYIYIVDRVKDIIITGGINVHSAEVENVISGHPAVMQVAVIGVPDPQWGEAIKAIVKLKAGQTATEDEIIEYCKEHLASYKKPQSVEFTDDLPISATGKILKRILREKYWQQAGLRDFYAS